MEAHSVQSDKGIGFAMLFSLLTLVCAGVLLAAPDQFTRAWGFAFAMTAASIAVVGTQVYWA